MEKLLSTRSQNVGLASSIEQNELVYEKVRQGKDLVILSYGEAPFRLPNITWDEHLFEKGSHYCEGLGIPEFRAELAEYILREHGCRISADNIMVSAGSKIISYFIAQTMLNEGDKVLLHEPCWVSYREHARLNGATVTFMPATENITQIHKYLESDESIKLIYLNNPNNPRGYLYKKAELERLVQVAAEHSCVVAVDESYSDFATDEGFYSCAHFIDNFENVVVFNSISKNFGLSGWRIGFALANTDLIQALNKFNQHLITCAPTCLQLALVGRLKELGEIIKPQIKDISVKRQKVENLLRELEFKFLEGCSTFYIFIDLSDYMSDTKEFALRLLEENDISVISGGAYGSQTSSYLRISFAIEPYERVNTALRLIKRRLIQG
jgi:aspartate/methionine/tyrosine aminotransferase